MEILPLGPEDTTLLAGAAEVENAANAVDAPWVHPTTVGDLRSRIRFGWDLEPARHVVAVERDRVVGLGSVAVSEWDNHDLAWLEVTVPPDVRRRGVGAAVFGELLGLAAEQGRTKICAGCWEGSPGEAFGKRFGLTRRSTEVNRRQHLAEVPAATVDRLHDEAAAAAAAYELVRVVGRVPDDLLEPVAVMTAAINDAPLDDLDIEDEVFPPQRIRDYETAVLSSGRGLYRLLARHRDSGEVVGHTVVVVEAGRPRIGYQHDTSVLRSHRGHRLGLLLKSGMNRWLAAAEPRLETVDTWNAESNDHMVAVNELLGYRWMGRGVSMQR